MIAMIPPKRPNLITGPAAPCLPFLLALSTLTSCVVETTTELAPRLGPRPVEEIAAWDAHLGGRSVGRVRLLHIDEAPRTHRLYKVEHADGQHAGWIDSLGRAWREEPFRDGRREFRLDSMHGDFEVVMRLPANGLVLVGMDTMAEDLRALLELHGAPELRRVDPPAERSATR